MANPWVFFYGSYLNLDVLKDVGIRAESWETATLAGFDILIAPRANIIPAEGRSVFGIVARVAHADLDRLYTHAREVLGEVYLPEAVLVQIGDGQLRPALTYICHNMEPRAAEARYVRRISNPARQYGFPDWYLERLDGFLP